MLTTQEQNTLQFIRNYLAQFGYAPKFKEIGQAIGVNSQGTVHRYVQSLEDKGYLNRAKGNARGMSLVELPMVSPPVIPLVGKIAAGLPIEAIEDQQELNLSELFMGPDLFALRVSGDSMVEAGILDNDYVIIKKQPVAHDGDIVVATHVLNDRVVHVVTGDPNTLRRHNVCHRNHGHLGGTAADVDDHTCHGFVDR